MVFSLGTVALMLFFQLFLTPVFYSMSKTNEYKSCAGTVKAWIGSEDWNPYDIESINTLRSRVVKLAQSNQLDIIINFPILLLSSLIFKYNHNYSVLS